MTNNSTGITYAVRNREWTFAQKWMLSLMMTGITVIGARLSAPAPGTPVPITFQVFGVLLSGMLLGGVWGSIAQIQYLALGWMGAPVFAYGHSGLITLFGITGGYLWSYPLAALLTGTLADRLAGQGNTRRIFVGRMAASMAGLAVIYSLGTFWLTSATHLPLFSGVVQGLLIFLGWDLVKATAAVMLLTPISRISQTR